MDNGDLPDVLHPGGPDVHASHPPRLRPGDPASATASLRERPIEVFADAAGTGLYNVHGQYMTAFERHTGLTMRWLGNPGTFGHCLAAIRRASSPAFLFEFDSYAIKYAEAGLPVHNPAEIQPYYPWSIAWRDEQLPQPITDLLDTAEETAIRRQWLNPPQLTAAPAWVPPDNPGPRELRLPGAPEKSTPRKARTTRNSATA